MKKICSSALTIILLLAGIQTILAQNLAPVFVTGTGQLSSPNTSGVYYNFTGIKLTPGFSTQPDLIFRAQVLPVGCIPLSSFPTVTQNFVITTTPRVEGITNNSNLASLSTCDAMQTIQYFDGIDRPLQTVQVKGSPTFNDLVQPFAYDAYGRETSKYLPYTSSVNDGSYKADAFNANAGQSQFYTSPPTSVAGTPNPLAQTAIEPSPLNRPVEQGAPGNDWQLGGHTVKITYTNNDQTTFSSVYTAGTPNPGSRQAVFYSASINGDGSRVLTNNSTYGNSLLSVTINANENWTAANGCLNTMEEYRDKLGRVLLKRTYNLNNSNPASPFVEMLSTYYVYDDKGSLAFVLPPAANPDAGLTTATNQSVLDNLCYQYRYDGRNRLTEKKLSGKGWDFFVYNSLDQVIFTQDANQRNQSPQVWDYAQYDAMGRVVITGLWGSGGAPGNAPDGNISAPDHTLKNWLISWAAAQTTLWLGRNNSTSTGYGAIDPQGIVLTVNYYDDYNFANQPSTLTAPGSASAMTAGMLTATKTAIINSASITSQPDMLWTVHYYDHFGRVAQTYAQHYLGGMVSPYNFDVVANTYYFTNEPKTTTRTNYGKNATNMAATTNVTIADSYVYDQVGRKTQSLESIDGATATMLNQLIYNEVGQVMKKSLNGSSTGTNFLQDIAYGYNERGWLTSNSSALFNMQLQYNANTTAVPGFTAQYNGNIASQNSTLDGQTARSYAYSYDNLNRLTQGISNDNFFNEAGISYDLNGNIKTLQRTHGTTTAIDNFTYNYSGTNQVQSITDAATDNSNFGYRPGTYSGYHYDKNGNMDVMPTPPNGQAVANINVQYNLLNLPQAITGGKTITYTYDALGNKLRRVSPNTGNTDYVAGIQYDQAAGAATLPTISLIQTEDGKASPLSSGGYYYSYYLADHLGNTRVTFDVKSGAIVTSQAQLDDYYPFGYEINRSLANTKNEYLYNKKELQEELQQYDYGARFYDPVIARWNTIDPVAELGRRWTPYGYGFDNSIRFEDPDGMWPDWSDVAMALGSAAQDLQQAWNGLNKVLKQNPLETAISVSRALNNGTMKRAVIKSVVKNTVKFATGNNFDKDAVVGTLFGEGAQLFGGEFAEFGKVEEFGNLTRVEEFASVASGKWVTEDISGWSLNTIEYQEQVTGVKAGSTLKVTFGGYEANFDGVRGNTYLEAKSISNDNFIDKATGEFKNFFKISKKGGRGLLKQARRQIGAANGASIEWHFSSEKYLEATKTLFEENGITSGINYIYTPKL